MKRLISGAEAVQAGIFPCLVDYGRGTDGRRWIHHVPAVEPTPNRDAYRLWRSRDGYRKACRMLRRAGRQIRRDRMLRKLAPNLYTNATMAKLLT